MLLGIGSRGHANPKSAAGKLETPESENIVAVRRPKAQWNLQAGETEVPAPGSSARRILIHGKVSLFVLVKPTI